MTMVASFMPSLAFAAAGDYTANDLSCWSYVPGSNSAKLVKAFYEEADHSQTEVSFDADATVKYYAGSTDVTNACGQTKNVTKIVFETKKKVAGNETIKWENTLSPASEITFPEHNYVTVPAKDATCTEAGNYEYKKCSVCGNVVGYDKDGIEFDSVNDSVIPARNHNVTLNPSSKYWIIGSSIDISVLTPLKCDDCGKSFTIDHLDTDVLSTAYDDGASVTTTSTSEASKDCTKGGAVTVEKATVVVDKNDVSIGELRADADINVNYVKKTSAPATTEHNFAGTSGFVWNDDLTKCVYKVNPCTNTGCEVAEKEIECTVTKKSNATCSTAAKPTIKATCTVTPEEGPITDVANDNPTLDAKIKVEAKLAHNYILVEAKEPTCTKGGYKAHYECTNGCADWFDKTADGRYIKVVKTSYEIPRTHTLSGDYTLPSKETLATDFFADGDLDSETATVKNAVCSKCGQAISGVTTANLSVDGKEYNKLNEGKNSCVDSIILPVVLTSGNYKDTVNVTLDPREHAGSANANPKFIWDTEDATNATCEVAFKSCVNKDWYFTGVNLDTPKQAKDACDAATVSQPATIEKAVTTEPTCTKTGEATYTASYKHSQTGKIYTETKKVVLPKAAHKTEVIPAVAATVFAKGKTAGVKCSVCGEVLTAPEEVDTLKVGTAKISSLKAGKKSFTVKASASNATGYRVYYKKAGAKKYSYTTVKAKNLSKTVKKLSAGKKYTVKVKAYAKNYDGDGQVVWGALSSGKTVKVK